MNLKNITNSRLTFLDLITLEKFKTSLEQIFLTVGQNNYGNKIPIFSKNKIKWKVKKIVGYGYQGVSSLIGFKILFFPNQFTWKKHVHDGFKILLLNYHKLNKKKQLKGKKHQKSCKWLIGTILSRYIFSLIGFKISFFAKPI